MKKTDEVQDAVNYFMSKDEQYNQIKIMQPPFKVSVKPSEFEGERDDVYIINEQGFHLCYVYNSEAQFIEGAEEKQAAHIVKCVNLHEELISALNDIDLNNHIKNEHLSNRVRSLLKRAKGGE